MCGIVGAVSNRNIVPILLQGLKRLEYRGYDSCGVAVHQDGGLKRARSTSRVAELEASVAADGIGSTTGIAVGASFIEMKRGGLRKKDRSCFNRSNRDLSCGTSDGIND